MELNGTSFESLSIYGTGILVGQRALCLLIEKGFGA